MKLPRFVPVACIVMSTSAPFGVLAASNQPIRPEIIVAQSVPQSLASTQSATPQNVEYQLPYPGILPDHPLYFLKQIRDALMDRLVTSPEKQIDLSILQADKRLVMGMLLMEKGKPTLAETTLSKGVKYLRSGMDTALTAKAGNRTLPGSVYEKFDRVTRKHDAVLRGLLGSSSGTVYVGLTGSLAVLESVRGDLDKLR